MIVAGPQTTGPVIDYQSGGMRNIRFFNNIFVTQRSLDLVKSSNTSAFVSGNLWYANGGAYDFRWGGLIQVWLIGVRQPVRQNA